MTASSAGYIPHHSNGSSVEEAAREMLSGERASYVTREELLLAVEEELQRLHAILSLLRVSSTETFPLPTGAAVPVRGKEKRALTPAGRMRISEAQKRRWERQRLA